MLSTYKIKISNEERENWKSILIHILEKQNRKNLVGCVIGVGRGTDIYIMHKFLDIKMLYLIDPYVPMRMRKKEKIIDDYVKRKPDAMKLVDEHKDTTVFIEDYAQRVTDRIPNDLDFSWMDALGLYDNNMEIFRSYYPKVKVGGVFAGKYFTEKWVDFKRALHDFEREQNIVFNKIADKNNINNGDWWVIKK